MVVTVLVTVLLAAFGVAGANAQQWQIRLNSTVAGATTWGAVEILRDPIIGWERVCHSGFGNAVARAACLSAGLTEGDSSRAHRRAFPQEETVNGTIGNFACSWTATGLESCTHTNSTCGATQVAVVACGEAVVPYPDKAWNYRVVDDQGGANASLTHGLLQVQRNTSDPNDWRTVCPDDFHLTEASIACRSLSLTAAPVAWQGQYLSRRGDATESAPVLADLDCGEQPPFLEFCDAPTEPTCSVSYPVLLACGDSSVPEPTNKIWQYRLSATNASADWGPLQVLRNETVGWEYVCEDSFGSSEAEVACRALGLTTDDAEYRRSFQQELADQHGTIGEFSCSWSSNALEFCEYESLTCDATHTVVLACGMDDVPYPDADALWNYRLVSDNGTVDATATSGILQVQRNTSDLNDWRPVCPRNFGSDEAVAACRSLNLSVDEYDWRDQYQSRQAAAASTTTPVLPSLWCGDEAPLLEFCEYDLDDTCSDDFPVLISCGTDYVPAPTTRLWKYRLNTTNASASWGPLQVWRGDAHGWEFVCSDSFHGSDARAACKSLGLSDSASSYRRVFPQEAPAVGGSITEFGCSNDDAALEFCDYSDDTCDPLETVVIACGESSVPYPAPAWNYRLVNDAGVANASATSGILQVQRDTSDPNDWRTVCPVNFAQRDADAACRSLGFDVDTVDYREQYQSRRGSGDVPEDEYPVLRSLSCGVDEPYLEFCDFSTSQCGESYPVLLSCGASPVPEPAPMWHYRLNSTDVSPTWGPLQVRQAADRAWETICESGFGSSDAEVACRALGLPTGDVAWREPYRQEWLDETWLSRFSCSSSQTALEFCEYDHDDCSVSSTVVLACGQSTVPYPTPAWNYRLASLNTSNVTNVTWGRAEVQRTADGAWEPVCYSSIGTTEAQVICRSAGFDASTAAVRAPVEQAEQPSSAPDISLYECDSSEVPQWEFCEHSVGADCPASEAAIVVCGEDLVPYPPTQWQYRLNTTNASASWGPLQVWRGAETGWENVCDNFLEEDAVVACRALGLPTDEVSWRLPFQQEQSLDAGSLYIFGCAGGESALEFCDYIPESCPAFEAVVLACGHTDVPYPAPAWNYRLASLNTSNVTNVTWGRAEVQRTPNGAWEAVCFSGIETQEAQVICRSAGFDSSTAAVRGPVGESEFAVGDSLATIERCESTDVPYAEFCELYDGTECSPDAATVIACGQDWVPYPAARWQYRLNTTNSSAAWGRLQVWRSGETGWESVCDNSDFGFNEQLAACRAIGMYTSTASSRRVVAPEVTPSTPTWSISHTCNGVETALEHCSAEASGGGGGEGPRGPWGPFEPWPEDEEEDGSCSAENAVVLACGMDDVPFPADRWQYRLNTTASQSDDWGVVEVRRTDDGPWETICEDSIESEIAENLCDAVGHRAVPSWNYDYRSAIPADHASTPTINIDSCRSGVTRPEFCELYPESESESESESECPFWSGALVLHCSSTRIPYPPAKWEYRLHQTGSSPLVGLFEFRRPGASEWQHMCAGDDVDETAVRSACASVGLAHDNAAYVEARSPSEHGNGTGARPYNCPASHAALEHCEEFTGTCDGSAAVVIACGADVVPEDEPAWRYRLANNATIGHAVIGRLEVRKDGATEWGTVCNNDGNFGSSERRAACRSLGLNTDRVFARSARVTAGFADERGTGEIAVTRAECYSWEHFYLEECFGVADGDGDSDDEGEGPGGEDGDASCTHDHDMILVCGGEDDASLPAMDAMFRLVGGLNTNYGRLEVKTAVTPDGAWGTVCADHFDVENAQVACRSLGLPSDTASLRPVGTTTVAHWELEAGRHAPLLSDVQCDGSERSLDLCSREPPTDDDDDDGDEGPPPFGDEGPFARQFMGQNAHDDDLELRGCDKPENAVIVSCGMGAAPPPALPAFDYRLVGGPTTGSGRLEVRALVDASQTQPGAGVWHSVCDSSFTIETAVVACRSLDAVDFASFPDISESAVGFRTIAAFELPSESAVRPRVCHGSERQLSECEAPSPHEADDGATCDTSRAIVLSCTSAVVPNMILTTAAPKPTTTTTTTAAPTTTAVPPPPTTTAAVDTNTSVNVTTATPNTTVAATTEASTVVGPPLVTSAVTDAPSTTAAPTTTTTTPEPTTTTVTTEVSTSTTMPPTPMSTNASTTPSVVETVPNVTTAALTATSTTATASGNATLPTVTTTAPVATVRATLPAGFVASLRAMIRIGGDSFGQLLLTRREELEAVVILDIARALLVDQTFVTILDMYEGSLVVDFAIDARAGVEPAPLAASLDQVSSSSDWLVTTQALYQTVTGESIGALEVISVSTAAPDPSVTNLNTPAPSLTVDSAAGVDAGSSDTDDASSTTAIAVVVVIVGIILVVAAVAGFVFYRKRQKSRKSTGHAAGGFDDMTQLPAERQQPEQHYKADIVVPPPPPPVEREVPAPAPSAAPQAAVPPPAAAAADPTALPPPAAAPVVQAPGPNPDDPTALPPPAAAAAPVAPSVQAPGPDTDDPTALPPDDPAASQRDTSGVVLQMDDSNASPTIGPAGPQPQQQQFGTAPAPQPEPAVAAAPVVQPAPPPQQEYSDIRV